MLHLDDKENATLSQKGQEYYRLANIKSLQKEVRETCMDLVMDEILQKKNLAGELCILTY